MAGGQPFVATSRGARVLALAPGPVAGTPAHNNTARQGGDQPVDNSGATDRELVRRVQAGDGRAFDLLFLKYQHRIFGLVSRYVRDREEIEDVVQEAFIKAFRALPRFRGDSQFYTWLYRIAINTAKNHLVARGRRPPATDVDAEDAEHLEAAGALREQATPENELAREQLAAAIGRAIDDLPDDLRSAVTLREHHGMSYEDIAAIMDCPVGTVRSRIFRAREAIDARIRPLLHSTRPGNSGRQA